VDGDLPVEMYRMLFTVCSPLSFEHRPRQPLKRRTSEIVSSLVYTPQNTAVYTRVGEPFSGQAPKCGYQSYEN